MAANHHRGRANAPARASTPVVSAGSLGRAGSRPPKPANDNRPPPGQRLLRWALWGGYTSLVALLVASAVAVL